MRAGRLDPGFVKAVVGTLVAKAVALALLLTVFQPTYWFNHLILDVFTWRDFFADVQRGLIPYVDMSREYPVGAGILYWAMAAFMDPQHGMGMLVVHGSFMFVADVMVAAAAWACFREISPRHAVAATLAVGLNLTALTHTPFRFESVLLVFVLAGWHAHLRGQPGRAALWWSLGAWVKWFPALLLAAAEQQAFVRGRRRQWVRSLAIFGVVAVVVNLPFLLAGHLARGSIDHWTYPYRFHLSRPLYWDTLFGLWQLWYWPAVPIERWASLVSLALVLLVMVVRPSMRLEGKAVLACLAGLAFNRFYSTQFHLWFYPFLIALVLVDEDRRRARTLAMAAALLDVLNVVVYPVALAYAFTEMHGFAVHGAAARGGTWTVVFTVAVILRVLAVCLLAVLVWRSARSRRWAPLSSDSAPAGSRCACRAPGTRSDAPA